MTCVVLLVLFSPPSEGGCAGKVKCNTDIICGEEAKVRYPGDIVSCSDQNDYLISPRCVTTPPDSESTEDCWDPNHPDDSKRMPYVFVKKSLNPGVDYFSKCTETVLGDTLDGTNEYGCALSCVYGTNLVPVPDPVVLLEFNNSSNLGQDTSGNNNPFINNGGCASREWCIWRCN